MKPKLRGLLGQYQIGNPVEGQAVPVAVHVYRDGIAIEMWKLKSRPNKVVIKKYMKQFDYKDMVLMNDTIQKIMRQKK